MFQFQDALSIKIERAEGHINLSRDLVHRLHVLDAHRGNLIRNIKLHRPTNADSLMINSACGFLGGGKSGNLEPRMIFQHSDELLPDHSGRAQNGDSKLAALDARAAIFIMCQFCDVSHSYLFNSNWPESTQ